MRRPARLVTTSVVALLAVAATTIGTATAATTAPSATRLAVVSKHKLGATPPSGQTSRPASAFATSRALTVLPAAVDLRTWAVTPGNQGQLNSCVAWVVDYALLGWYSRYTGRAGAPFAPMYTYSQINGGADHGAEPRAALAVAVKQGNDTAAHYVKGDNWKHQPTAAERANAAKYKITGYDVLFNGANQPGVTTALKTALAAKRPVAIKLAVRDGFDFLATRPASIDTDITSPVRGYHEVLALGYDAAGIIVQNSWGTGWGNGGFGRIAWRVVQKDVSEAETVRGLAPLPTRPVVSAPTARRTGYTNGKTTVVIALTWRGRAGNTGAISRYDAWYQIDGKARVALPLASPTATTTMITARLGHRYRISVRARSGYTLGSIVSGSSFTA